MDKSKHEKLKHNPEKGLSGNEKDSDKKDSKKTDNKQKSSEKNTPENRPARFFQQKKDDDASAQEKRDKKFQKSKEKNRNTSVQNENEVDSKEVNESSGVENAQNIDITEQEAREAASQITQARQEDVFDNLSRVENESLEEAEELAAAAFLTNLERLLASGDDVSEDMLDTATRETFEDMDFVSDDDKEQSQDFQLPDGDNQEVENTINNGDTEGLSSQQATGNNPQSQAHHSMGGSPASTQGLPTLQSGNSGGGSNIPPSHRNGGQSGFPPMPPIQPPQSPYFFNHNTAQPNFNTTDRQNNTADQEYSYSRRRAKHLLIGGIVGYMIGRRGGRKRTEKRLQPQIDSLEKQIATLHDEIARREEYVRSIARKQAENTRKELEKPGESFLKGLKTNQERVAVFITKQRERLKEQEKKQTTQRLHEEGSIKKMAETHLQSLGLFVERRNIDGTENTRKRFETMNEQELKKEAKDIVVDGISVLAAYESRRIDRQTLLEVTKRFYRRDSGSFEAIFRSNILPDEIELNRHRDRLYNAHNERKLSSDEQDERARGYAKEITKGFYSRDTSTFDTDEERQAYFQRYADEEAQASEFGKLLKKVQNGSIIKSKTAWISLLFVIVVGMLVWIIGA